jgi:hypothetical protein
MKSSSLLLLFSVAFAIASPLLDRDQQSHDKVLGVAKGSNAPVAHGGALSPVSQNGTTVPQNGTTNGERDLQARNMYDWIQWTNVWTWPEGTPVGGDSLITIWSSGYAQFKSHFHDSGWPSYDVYLTCVLHDRVGRAYTFAHQGRMHGTDEAGSRDFDADETEYHWDIQAYWADIENGDLLMNCNAYIS